MLKSSSLASMWGGWLGRKTKRTSCILPALQYVNKREFVKRGLDLGKSLSLSITSPSFGAIKQLL